jgi:phosphate transport system protein
MRKRHTEPSYDVDLDHIRERIGAMCALVGGMLDGSLSCLARRDGSGAGQIAARDREVNALEVEIDECCLALLARWQPVASDLRFVGATLKLVTDLERVGDHCANICERVVDLHGERRDPPGELVALISAVPALLQDAFAAWRGEDARLAVQVIERGQRLDALAREVLRGCFELSRQDPGSVAAAVGWHEIAGYLHRIGGHATNIAEMVIFQVRGEDVRHLGRLPAEEGSHP